MANEKRLIDLDKLLIECEKTIAYAETDQSPTAPYTAAAVRGFAKYLETCPTVDAVEVVHGRWIAADGEGVEYPDWVAECEIL